MWPPRLFSYQLDPCPIHSSFPTQECHRWSSFSHLSLTGNILRTEWCSGSICRLSDHSLSCLPSLKGPWPWDAFSNLISAILSIAKRWVSIPVYPLLPYMVLARLRYDVLVHQYRSSYFHSDSPVVALDIIHLFLTFVHSSFCLGLFQSPRKSPLPIM